MSVINEKTKVTIGLATFVAATFWVTTMWNKTNANAANLSEFKVYVIYELRLMNEKLDKILERLPR